MSDEIQVGDLIFAYGHFMVVQEISLEAAAYYGNWAETESEARACAQYRDAIRWGRIDRRVAEKVRRATSSAPSTGTCTCTHSFLAKGCTCGAITPYKRKVLL